MSERRIGGSAATFLRLFRDAGQVVLAAFAGALIIKLFVLDAVYIPSRSMEGTLRKGDYVLVNKILYGARLSPRLPVSESRIGFLHLPGLAPLARGDVVVFELPAGAFPDSPEERVTFVKRCVALAGDEVAVGPAGVFVNGSRLEAIGSEGGDRFGPVRVPRKGDILRLDPARRTSWERLILSEGHRIETAGGQVLIDGAAASSYQVEQDHVFVLGDNLGRSYDSRYWGFLPESNIVGSAMMVYWSADPGDSGAGDGRTGAVRWDRIGGLIR